MSISQLVPFAGMVFVLAVIIGPLWVRSHFAAKERAQLHETLRVAWERGQTVPPELINSLRARADDSPYDRWGGGPRRDLRRGLVLIGVGIGLVCLGAGLYFGLSQVSAVAGAITGGAVAGAGSIPGLIGVAYLVVYALRQKDPAANALNGSPPVR